MIRASHAGSYDSSSSSSASLIPGHSLWLYSIFPSLLFVCYCLIASLVVNLSDSSMCQSPIRSFLYLSIALYYCFIFFLCYLFLFGRPKTRTLQNTFLVIFSIANMALTLWGSASVYSSAIIESGFSSYHNSTTPLYAADLAAFLNASPCTQSLAFRVTILGLAINYLYWAFFSLLLLYGLFECLCCRKRMARTEVLGIGGIERTRARQLFELRQARDAGHERVQQSYQQQKQLLDHESPSVKKPRPNTWTQ